MLRLLAALALATSPLWLAEPADACSCVPRSFAAHAKAETRVVLAKAGKPIKNGDALKQTFTVLAAFKGSTQPFTLDRRATPPCAANYKENEIAILFSSDDQLDPCHGNLPLVSVAPDLPAILKATNTKTTDPTALAIESGLRELTMYLHQRPQVAVRYAPLAGQSITIDQSKLTFAKTAAPKDLAITAAVATDRVTVLQGTYGVEGVRFVVVLYLDGKTWKVAHASVVET
jgi:hypothetical protein